MGKIVAMAAAAVLVLSLPAASGASERPRGERSMVDGKRNCVYSAHRLSTLRAFTRLVGGRPDCVLVFNDAAPDWAGWQSPWFAHHGDPDLNWARWKGADPARRRLVITQSLIPSGLRGSDWIGAAARGQHAEHARALARNLVAAGLGDSVIRLAHEANFTKYAHSLPNTAAGQRAWGRAWRRQVLAMKSVPGARFRFDLTVNAAVRPIPLERFWPGDDVVDIVGVDAYDAGVRERRGRWRRVYDRPMGIRTVLRFAKAHGKPLSIPEWGVGPRGSQSLLSGGDNPEYVRGIARVMRHNRTAYQSYFFNHEWAAQLPRSPRSLRVYRRYLRPGR